jgi:sortase A
MTVLQPPGTAVILAVVLSGLGLTLLGYGLWIPAKARLAQELIAVAWKRSLAGESEVRPWSWADTWPVARLIPPKQSSPLYVLAHASGQSLAFGPAHVSASAAPYEADNVAIAGHRDTHFAFLKDLEVGHEIRLETTEGIRTYLVTSTHVVHESRTDLLERTGRAELTLITCYPFDAVMPGGPLRYVVHAEMTRAEEEDLGSAMLGADSAGSRPNRPVDSPPSPGCALRRDCDPSALARL